MSFDYSRDWKHPVNIIGRWTMWIAVVSSFVPALYLLLAHDISPDWEVLLQGWLIIVSLFGMLYVLEPVTYFSVLGLSGIYLSMLAGNVGNMRVPCAMMGLEATDTTPGTPRADIVSTLAICGSVIANLVMLTCMAFVGAQILHYMPEKMVQAFQLFTIPSVYGAMFIQSGLKNLRLVPFGLGIPLAMMLLNVPSYLVTFITVVCMIALARFFYKRDQTNA